MKNIPKYFPGKATSRMSAQSLAHIIMVFLLYLEIFHIFYLEKKIMF